MTLSYAAVIEDLTRVETMKLLKLLSCLIVFAFTAVSEPLAGGAVEASEPPEFDPASLSYFQPNHGYDETDCSIYGEWQEWYRYEPIDSFAWVTPEKLVISGVSYSWQRRADLTSVEFETWPPDKFGVYMADEACTDCIAFFAVFIQPDNAPFARHPCRLTFASFESLVGRYLDLHTRGVRFSLYLTE